MYQVNIRTKGASAVKVYIAAAAGTDLSIIQSLLRSLGAEPISDGNYNTDTNASLEKDDVWSTLDAVIGIPKQPDGSPSQNALIEIGVAIGRNLPLILISQEDLTAYDLHSLKIIRAAPTNAEALRFHLTLFIKSVSEGKWNQTRPLHSPKVTSDLGHSWDNLYAIRKMATGEFRGEQYEHWAAELLGSMGATVVSAAANDRGFDLVLSLPDATFRANPVVVEVKGRTSRQELKLIIQRMHNLVVEERGGLGLVLFDDELSSVREPSALSLPTVVTIGMNDLLQRLELDPSLDRVLSRERNKVAHS